MVLHSFLCLFVMVLFFFCQQPHYYWFGVCQERMWVGVSVKGRREKLEGGGDQQPHIYQELLVTSKTCRRLLCFAQLDQRSNGARKTRRQGDFFCYCLVLLVLLNIAVSHPITGWMVSSCCVAVRTDTPK